MALELTSTVDDTSTSDRGRREVPAAARDSGVGLSHDIYRKSSHFCQHQEVCEDYAPKFLYTPPAGKKYH